MTEYVLKSLQITKEQNEYIIKNDIAFSKWVRKRLEEAMLND